MALDTALALLAAHPLPRIAVVGSPARTWRIDGEELGAFLELVYAYAPDCEIVHAGAFPFDVRLDELGLKRGLGVVMIGPAYEERLAQDYQRDPCILDGCQLLVVFPGEGEHPEHVDPLLYVCAKEQGIPVLIHRRGFECELDS